MSTEFPSLFCIKGPAARQYEAETFDFGEHPIYIVARDRAGKDATASDAEWIVAVAGPAYIGSATGEPEAAVTPSGLLEVVHKHGDRALERLRGAFYAVLFSKSDGTMKVYGDRIGAMPIFWSALPDGGLALAHRLEDLARLSEVDVKIDLGSIQNYLFFYSIPAPSTVYSNVRRMSPGSILVHSGSGVKEKSYWSMPYSHKESSMKTSDIREKLLHLLEKSVSRSYSLSYSDAVGTYLSGGLDSSTVTGLASRKARRLPSFTVRFNEPEFDEGKYARIAASHFGTEHHEIFLEARDVVNVFEKMAAFFNQPYGNTSSIAAYYCAAAAKDAGVDVLFAGDGGDELFAGNERYLLLRRPDVYGRIPALVRALALDKILASEWLDPIPVLGKAHRLRKRFHMSYGERMYEQHGPFRKIPLSEVFSPEVLTCLDENRPLATVSAAADAHCAADPTQLMMAIDLRLTISDNDLIKVNETAALAGIQVQYPMLDDEILEFAAGLPGDILLEGGELRGFFKKTLSILLPEAIIEKPKHGFGLPFYNWIKSDKRLQDCILDGISALGNFPLFTEAYRLELEKACTDRSTVLKAGDAWDAAILSFWLMHHRHSF